MLLSEKSKSEEVTLQDSNWGTFWKRQHYGDREKISSCQRGGGGRGESAEPHGGQ